MHVARDGGLEVYHSAFPFLRSGRMSFAEFEAAVKQYAAMLDSSPLGVLVTCERAPAGSAMLPRLLDLLFEPAVQILYMRAP